VIEATQHKLFSVCLLCIGLWLLASASVFAQDAHYSQFYRDPLYLNPANTGNFVGQYRFHAHHRNQWSAVSRAFQTFGLGADAANFLGIKKVGAGINFFNDVAGDGNLSNLQVNGSLSYALQLSKDSTQLLFFGVQGGLWRRQLDFSKLNFDDQYTNGSYKPGLPSAEVLSRTSINNLNANAGIAYVKRTSLRKEFSLGITAHNLLQPSIGFNDPNELLSLRYGVHATLVRPLFGNVDILPGALAMLQGPHREIMGGSNFRVLLDDRPFNYRAFQAGVWHRWEDAWVFFAGVDWGTLQVGASYDVNTSGLNRASRGRGAWEISVIYIIRDILPKRMNFKSCPDFI